MSYLCMVMWIIKLLGGWPGTCPQWVRCQRIPTLTIIGIKEISLSLTAIAIAIIRKSQKLMSS